jgi:diketogulonate reductase-like aldo/keto reductase
MQFYNKYLKYKNKYLSLKKQLGGNYLSYMPQLCFGTAQHNLSKTLKIALHENNIRHIDCADGYGGLEYLEIIKKEIKKIPRKKLWITWKSDNTSIENIIKIIESLECIYIDTFLVHHDYNCQAYIQLKNLNEAKKIGIIRFIGVSNCENIDKLIEYKNIYDIDTIQIQARPPNGTIDKRGIKINPYFIEIMNLHNINVMLFGTISGITNLEDFSIIYSEISNVNKYYLQKYCLHKNNILIISSVSGSSIEINKIDFENIIAGKDLLTESKIEEIESKLKTLVLNFQ